MKTKHIILLIVGTFVILFIIAGIYGMNDPKIQADIKHDDSVQKINDSIDHVKEIAAQKQQQLADASKEKEQNEKIASDKGIDAFVMSQEFLKKKLKAPATAKFPDYENKSVQYLGDSIYTVVSYVDAQNTYGALLRSGYHCSLKYEGENWQLITVSLDE